MQKRAMASALVGVLVAGVLALAAPSGLAHGTLKKGKWVCYNYAFYPPTPVTSIHFKKGGVYITPVGSTNPKTKGKWKHNPDRAVIRFTSGPLHSRKLKAKHKKISGEWWVRMFVKVDGKWEYSYSCFRSTK